MIATTSLPQLPGKTCTGCGGCTNACPKDAIFFGTGCRGLSASGCAGQLNVLAARNVSKSVRFCTGRAATSLNRICMLFGERTTFEQIAPLVAFSLWLPRKSLHGKALSLEQRLTKTCIFRSPSPKMKSSLLPCGVQNMCRVTRNWFTGMHSTA